MSAKLSVEEVLSNLERRAAFHRDQEALHTQQEAHHREQRALHAAELEKVLQSLEAFGSVAASAVELARPVAETSGNSSATSAEELPPPNRLMVARLLELVVESPSFPEPFGPTAVADEANRRFADRLSRPIGQRTASDVLRRLLKRGVVKLAQEGKAFHEALYKRGA